MADRTERQLREELSEISDDRDGSDGFDAAADELSVEWREADPEARPDGMEWDPETGTIHYDVWSAQQTTLDALAGNSNESKDDEDAEAEGEGEADPDLLGFLAGYGSGKSVFGARWLIAQALEYPGSHFLVMGTTFSEARSSTFPKLFGQLPGENTTLLTSSFNGPEESPIVEDYNRQDNRVTLANSSVITLGSADKWSRYAGSEFGAAWLDEPSHYGSDLFDLLEMMGSGLRGVDGSKKQLWTLTGNGYNAAYEILSRRLDSNGDPIGLNIEVVRASTLENPYLSDAEKERFKRQYSGTGREEQALHGGFEAAQGLVYSNFSRENHVIPTTQAWDMIGDEYRVYGYDAGWNDPRVLLEVGRTLHGQLVVLDEFHESETHVEDTIGWLADNPDGTIFAEHEPADNKRFVEAGWKVKKAAKSLDAGIAEVQRRLRADGNAPINEAGSRGFETTPDPSPRSDTDAHDGRVGLLVSANCEHLIQEFLSYKTDEVGTSRATDHCLDALRYACMGVAGNDQGDGGGKRTPQSIPSTW